jgi:hypothetical protein
LVANSRADTQELLKLGLFGGWGTGALLRPGQPVIRVNVAPYIARVIGDTTTFTDGEAPPLLADLAVEVIVDGEGPHSSPNAGSGNEELGF